MASRDFVMIGIGLSIGFFLFTAIGRDVIKTGVGVSKSEAERLLRKVEKRSKERAKG